MRAAIDKRFFAVHRALQPLCTAQSRSKRRAALPPRGVSQDDEIRFTQRYSSCGPQLPVGGLRFFLDEVKVVRFFQKLRIKRTVATRSAELPAAGTSDGRIVGFFGFCWILRPSNPAESNGWIP